MTAWSGRAQACGRFARRLETLVRAEGRRDGCPVDDEFGEWLWEMVEVGDEYRNRNQASTAATMVDDMGCDDLAARTVVAVVIDPHSPAAKLICPLTDAG